MELPELGVALAYPLHAERLNGTGYSTSLPGRALRFDSANTLACVGSC